MTHTVRLAILTALTAAGSSVALASGVSLTQPRKPAVVPASYACPSGQCGQQPCGDPSGCGCGPLGAACLDGATPPACSAEGVCVPKRSTFGHHRTNWRRWPGDVDEALPDPLGATEGDELLKPFDTPPPEKEDQQAPPPIEEDPGNTGVEEEDELPPLEIDLPPLPEQRPFDPPFAPEDEGPPPPPFGAKPRQGPTMSWRAQSDDGSLREVRRLPELPVERGRSGEARRPRTADRNGDTPPPLPGGFTLHRDASLPTLQRPTARFDAAVRQASATGPARVGEGR